MPKKYSLTPEHRAQLKPHNDKWIEIALRTTPQSEDEKARAAEAVCGLYAAANLPNPINVVFCSSPITAAIAGTIAAGAWYLREHPEFIGNISEPQLTQAIATACAIATGFDMSAATRAATSAATRAATHASTRAATYEATSAATYEATRAATYEATRAATSAATRAATYEATSAATYEATYEATRAATYEATYEATRAATYEATYEATRAAMSAATYEATRAAMSAATYEATRAATYEATRAATYEATYEATRAATHAATDASTRAATYEATDEATRAATSAATRAAMSAATYEATSAAVSFMLGCCSRFWNMWDAGNQWAGWCSYLAAGRYVYKLPIDYNKFDCYEQLARLSGPRVTHAKFAILSDFPMKVECDERHRPHCADGPQMQWADGTDSGYYWHGTKVPARVIVDPESYTGDEIRALKNSEITRALAEHMGWDKFIERLGARVVDVCEIKSHGEDGQLCTLKYELLESEHRFADRQPKWLRMQSPPLKDGTQPSYIEPVDPNLKTASAARTWKFRRSDGSWPTVERCNDGLLPDWYVRQGDVVFHEMQDIGDTANKTKRNTNVLVSGSATGHSHVLKGRADVWEQTDGTRIVRRLSQSLSIVHEEHRESDLRELSRQSIARQYDRENGWVDVQD